MSLGFKMASEKSKDIKKRYKKQQMANALHGEQEVDNATNPEDLWTNDKVKGMFIKYCRRQGTTTLPAMNTLRCWHIWPLY